MVKGEVIGTRYGLGELTRISGQDYYVKLFECDPIWIIEEKEISELGSLIKELV